jgi:hypothetical protein
VTFSRRIERLHVKDIDTLHLSQDFESLETSGLIQIGRDRTDCRTGTDQIILGFDLCESSW